MESQAEAALKSRSSLSSSRYARQEGKLTSYSEVFICLLASLAIDNIIAKDDMKIMNLEQFDESAVEHAQALSTKV